MCRLGNGAQLGAPRGDLEYMRCERSPRGRFRASAIVDGAASCETYSKNLNRIYLCFKSTLEKRFLQKKSTLVPQELHPVTDGS